MSEQHTQGRLVLEDRGYTFIVSKPGDGYVTRDVCRMDGSTMAAFDQRANARRLVACWNACDGIPVEMLEAMPSDPAALLPMYARLVAQRDELLKVLEQCRFALEPYDDVKPRDWKTDRERLAFAHQAACSAITKATTN